MHDSGLAGRKEGEVERGMDREGQDSMLRNVDCVPLGKKLLKNAKIGTCNAITFSFRMVSFEGWRCR